MSYKMVAKNNYKGTSIYFLQMEGDETINEQSN